MIRKFVFLFVALPIAVLLIFLSVANRQSVTMSLDPFNTVSPAFSFSLPFFVFLFLALLSGMLIGSLATWFKQGKHRKEVKEKKSEALKWQSEAEAQKKRAEDLAVELHPELASLPKPSQAA